MLYERSFFEEGLRTFLLFMEKKLQLHFYFPLMREFFSFDSPFCALGSRSYVCWCFGTFFWRQFAAQHRCARRMRLVEYLGRYRLLMPLPRHVLDYRARKANAARTV